MAPRGKKREKLLIVSFLSFFLFYFGLSHSMAHAFTDLPLGRAELTDEELASVTAQSGISIVMDTTMDVRMQTAAWGDPDGHSAASGAGWIGYRNLEINTLHIWPRTDYTMDSSKWNLLEFLTYDVLTIADPETESDHGDLCGLDHVTMLRIGLPTLTVSMGSMRGELMLGPSGSACTIGGVVNGDYVNGKTIYPANLNQSLGSFELRDMNLSTGGGEILLGPHGTDTAAGKTGSGITVRMSGTSARLELGYVGLSDTDNGNWIGLEGFTVDDGAGGYFSYDTPTDVPITFDVGSTDAGRTAVALVMSDHVLPRTYSADHLVFCGQDTGSIRFGGVSMGPSLLVFASHDGGAKGIDFENITQFNMDTLEYAYNTTPTSFNMSGVHAAGSATGAPEDPSTWSFSGGFQIGDLDGEDIDVDSDPTNPAVPNPATVDVGTDTATGNTTMVLGVPMKGAVRIENVSFGGTSFGPCAIDGITVHRLNMTFSPN